MKIVPYQSNFLKQVQNICVETADEKFKENATKVKVLLETYNNYYTEFDKDFAFVLYDEKTEKVCGYIICAFDFDKYIKKYLAYNCRKIAKISLKSAVQSAADGLVYLNFKKEYPSHLHIDILSEYTNGGWGTKLMETLVEKLKQCHSSGVCLCVGKDNIRAASFYEKCGFKKLKSLPGAYIMGKKLN